MKTIIKIYAILKDPSFSLQKFLYRYTYFFYFFFFFVDAKNRTFFIIEKGRINVHLYVIEQLVKKLFIKN